MKIPCARRDHPFYFLLEGAPSFENLPLLPKNRMMGNGIPPEVREKAQGCDRLALIRTMLANERTYLAYLRSSLALIATGASAIHFLRVPAAVWAGVVIILIGLSCLGFGALRFLKVRRAISEARPDDTQSES
jgi:putative membrane protein